MVNTESPAFIQAGEILYAYALAWLVVLVTIYRVYGFYGLTHPSYRHAGAHGGVGRRRWSQAPNTRGRSRKVIHRRRVNHYSVEMVLRMAQANRGEHVSEPILGMDPGQFFPKSIVKPRDGMSDSGFDLLRDAPPLRSWDQYQLDRGKLVSV